MMHHQTVMGDVLTLRYTGMLDFLDNWLCVHFQIKYVISYIAISTHSCFYRTLLTPCHYYLMCIFKSLISTLSKKKKCSWYWKIIATFHLYLEELVKVYIWSNLTWVMTPYCSCHLWKVKGNDFWGFQILSWKYM